VHKGADHRDAFARTGGAHPVADRDRIILADHLAEVAESGQVVVQATVGDEEDLAV